MLDRDLLARAAGRREPNPNLLAFAAALDREGARAGLGKPHRLASYLAQWGHESMGFVHDRELWGPTAAQRRYEGRRDLGNAQPGDGYRFRGRTAAQLTGRANYRSFTAWARERDPSAPDFEAEPDALLTDPWEGLVPLWYWDTGNPTRASLNRYADAGNHEMVTRRINGGLNGYDDRLRRYTVAGLALLGRATDDVRGFQRAAGLAADGLAGPATRTALHAALSGLPDLLAPAPAKPEAPGWDAIAKPTAPTPDDPAALIAEATALLNRAVAALNTGA